VIGWLLLLLAMSMLVPMFAELVDGHPDWRAFLVSAGITGFIGVLLILTNRRPQFHLQFRALFLLTTLSWLLVALFSALPLQLGAAQLSLTDAVFEAMSGMTTTGSTVITGLDRASRGLLLWRSLLHALGGIGIIVMAIVLLPFLRVGGMQLFRTESSDRSEKLFPNTAVMVRRLLIVYLFLVIACALSLVACGFSLFDAVNHSFSAISTGGFSTRDASIGGFHNPVAEWLLILFMALGALPFLRMVAVLQGRPALFLGDSQIRLFAAFCALVTAVLAGYLMATEGRSLHDAVRAAAFNAVSIITTTGFASEDYQLWGAPAVALFLGITIVGGCTGSTAGGIKVFRFEILWTAAKIYLVGLFLPNRVARPRYHGKPIDSEIIIAVLSFVFFFIGTWGLFTVALGALGLDLVTAVSGAATALANVGPGLGHVIGPAGNFVPLPDPAKWLLTLAMLLGRLEFFTVLVLFHPAFWRR
jgi:trk system potassium uptake protein TrkH